MRDRNKEQFIEETGLLIEALGMTRMSGRIFGALLVSEKEMISFYELVELLQASKSSISTNTRALLTIGFIRMITLPADRKTYYALNENINWGGLLRNRMKMLNLFKILLKKAWELRDDKYDKTSDWTAGAIEFYEWTEKVMSEMIDDYEQKQTKNTP